jgi:uncharacterized damage-inducible protein DinB
LKEYLSLLSKYNIWANIEVCKWLTQLTEEQFERSLASSFPTIKATITHIIAAESIWLQRLNKVLPTNWIGNNDLGTKVDIIQLWNKTSLDLNHFCDNIPNEKLLEVIKFYRLNGEENSLSIQEMCTHVFNHSTYHRGQLVTMFRSVGFTEVSPTDLLIYYNINT